MKRAIALIVAVSGLGIGSQAYAQDRAIPDHGAVVVSVVPGGATFFTKGKDTQGPGFVNYGLGAGVEVAFNRYVGVEGEIAGALGVTQDLDFASGTSNLKSPSLLNYNGNLVISAANRSAVVPYVAGGIGGLTVFDEATLGIGDTQTFLTGNVGAGVKWFSATGRWGVRGDYRFLAVRANDDASAFFGQETRYGHRLNGSVLIRIGR